MSIDMSKWPKSRDERLCPHGVGHAEPGKPHHAGGIHGCDGCCWSTPKCDCGAENAHGDNCAYWRYVNKK